MTIARKKFAESSYGGEITDRYTGVIQSLEAPVKKRYLYKIYDSAGTYLTTWNDVSSEPTFSIDLNGGFSELEVELARSENKFDEGESVAYGNQLKLYVFDKDGGYDGVLIYSGFLSRYIPKITGSRESLQITFLSYWANTSDIILEEGGKTYVSYVSEDPTNILKDVLDKFTADGGKLDYDAGTTQNTATTTTYRFNCGTYQEVLQKIVEIAPYDWYLRIGADDKIYFKQKSATADHKLTLGKEISDYVPEKRIENIINTIYLTGGGDPKLYKKYESAGSITTYGIKSVKYVDEKITDTGTADKVASRILENFDSPEIRVVIKVLDNSGENYRHEQGYDIESLKVGDTVKIFNATSKGDNYWDTAVWDTDAWDYDITNAAGLVLQIVKLNYSPDYATIELSNKQPDLARRIEEINNAFIASRTADNPSTPTT